MDVHRDQMLRGYLAMLVVEKPYRSLGTGAMCAAITYSVCQCILLHCLLCHRCQVLSVSLANGTLRCSAVT